MRGLALFLLTIIGLVGLSMAPKQTASARVTLPVSGLICHPGEPIPTPCLPPPAK